MVEIEKMCSPKKLSRELKKEDPLGYHAKMAMMFSQATQEGKTQKEKKRETEEYIM